MNIKFYSFFWQRIFLFFEQGVVLFTSILFLKKIFIETFARKKCKRFIHSFTRFFFHSLSTQNTFVWIASGLFTHVNNMFSKRIFFIIIIIYWQTNKQKKRTNRQQQNEAKKKKNDDGITNYVVIYIDLSIILKRIQSIYQLPFKFFFIIVIVVIGF